MLRLQGRGRIFWTVAGTLSLGLVFAADLATGPEVAFSLFYLVPIALTTWFAGRRAGLVVSIVGSVMWFAADDIGGIRYSHPSIRYWNAAVRLGFFLVVTFLLPALKALEAERMAARVDALTGTANRRRVFETLQSEMDRYSRAPRPFTVAYFDLDNFKQVNDRAGHAAGDAVLRAVSRVAVGGLRRTDLVGRLGGDEFVAVMFDTDTSEAPALVQALHASLVQELAAGEWPLTVSIGAVTYQGGPATPDVLIGRADALMYSVKRNGKNSMAFEVYAG